MNIHFMDGHPRIISLPLYVSTDFILKSVLDQYKYFGDITRIQIEAEKGDPVRQVEEIRQALSQELKGCTIEPYIPPEEQR